MEPWRNEPGSEHLAAYRRIVERLRGLNEMNRSALERLRADLEIVLQNDEATRRLLADEVYGVPREWLDEMMRLRMEDLES